jgi:type IV pilus assembly protein PilB
MAKPLAGVTTPPNQRTKPTLRGRISLSNETIPIQTLLLLPQNTASQYHAVVFRQTTDRKTKQNVLSLAAVDPTEEAIQKLVEFLVEHNSVQVQLYEATAEEIDAQLARYLGVAQDKTTTGEDEGSNVTAALSTQKDVGSSEELQAIVQSAVIPTIVTGIMSYAMVRKASDVHIEPLIDSLRVRYRVDGNLVLIATIPRYFRNAVISRIKILSQMKIDETRVPQDGRFEFDFHAHAIDVRVSTLPTVHGEKVVMRLLDKDSGIITLEQLGITGSSFDALVKAINHPYGVILATGPTGSGKSTTLYAILNRIAHPNTNVVTLEDPVEYEIAGANQSQVKPVVGYTFAEGLRAVLRQDPNIIMVGEVRDLETASLVTHAALTGHLVLTTLHTNDAAGALPRLINIGVEPFLLTSALRGILAQRLVRKLCVACRQQVQLSQGVIDQIRAELTQLRGFPVSNQDNFTFYQAVGCGKCTDGYSGRIGIYEVLTMSETIESLAISKQPASVIDQAARQEGMISLKQDGILKALKGITTVDEVWRVTSET